MSDVLRYDIMIAPRLDVTRTIVIVGQFYPTPLSNDNPTNWFTEDALGHTLLRAAMMAYESSHRNAAGVKFHSDLLEDELNSRIQTREETSASEAPAEDMRMLR